MNPESKLNWIYQNIRKEFRAYSSISIGIFLFILFFQPFELEKFDLNNRLLFDASLGIIIFLLMIFIRIIFPGIIQKYPKTLKETVLKYYLRGFLLFSLSSVSFTFFLYYVGSVNITFYVVFKVVLICLAPPFILRLYDMLNELRDQNELLLKDKLGLQNRVEKFEENDIMKTVLFISENSAEKINLLVTHVLLIKSADNYVDIIYKEEDEIKKKLLRNTLKNIEYKVNDYKVFVRCHRTCIVNINYAEKLNRKFNNYWLSIKGIEEDIPVSRQYILQIREALLVDQG